MRSTILLPSHSARKELNRLMAEFLSRKGKIQRVRPGQHSEAYNAYNGGLPPEQWGWQGLTLTKRYGQYE